jgi:serine O-acetyltransferase
MAPAQQDPIRKFNIPSHSPSHEMPLISSTEPDWSREAKSFWHWYPSRSLLAAIRSYQRASGPFAALIRAWAKWRHRLWSVVTGADIPLGCDIGGGLILPHPNGVVIAPDAKIGPNCLFFQQVTIGNDGRGVPHLAGHIDIGAGAKLLGPITIGEHARVGANAVVLIDVPPYATAVGVPAKILEPGSASKTLS